MKLKTLKGYTVTLVNTYLEDLTIPQLQLLLKINEEAELYEACSEINKVIHRNTVLLDNLMDRVITLD